MFWPIVAVQALAADVALQPSRRPVEDAAVLLATQEWGSVSVEEPAIRCAEAWVVVQQPNGVAVSALPLVDFVFPSLERAPLREQLTGMVAAWNRRYAASTFSVEDSGRMVHVKPATVLDADCISVPYEPLLDTIIDSPTRLEDPALTFERVLGAVAATRGVVLGGEVWGATLSGPPVSIPTRGVRARDALLATMPADRTHAWMLRYGSASDAYFLNVVELSSSGVEPAWTALDPVTGTEDRWD